MSDSNPSIAFFHRLARILLRCWLFGLVLLILWLGAILFAGQMLHQLHGNMFGLSAHELDLIFYCGIGLLKVLVLVFFFIPWLAIRLELSNQY